VICTKFGLTDGTIMIKAAFVGKTAGLGGQATDEARDLEKATGRLSNWSSRIIILSNSYTRGRTVTHSGRL
jgi:hypothetical protein